MKHIITLLFLLLFAVTSQAEIYKGTDDEGNVIYSDEELPNSEIVPELSPNTITMPKAEPKQPVVKDKKETGSYTSFMISSPINNQTIRSSAGTVLVAVSVTPKLFIKQGHRIAVFIDGKVSISTTKSSFEIPNLDRGSHTLRAEIRNKSNKVLKTSNKVTFHMKRFSTQHKKPPKSLLNPA